MFRSKRLLCFTCILSMLISLFWYGRFPVNAAGASACADNGYDKGTFTIDLRNGSSNYIGIVRNRLFAFLNIAIDENKITDAGGNYASIDGDSIGDIAIDASSLSYITFSAADLEGSATGDVEVEIEGSASTEYYSKVLFRLPGENQDINHNKGSLMLDLMGGSTTVPEIEADCIDGTLKLIKQDGAEPEITVAKIMAQTAFDLDRDGSYDVMAEKVGGLTDFEVLKTSSIKGREWEISLKDATLARLSGNTDGFDFYEEIMLIFPKDPENIGVTLKTTYEDYDLGEYLIDLTEENYYAPQSDGAALLNTMQNAADSGQIRTETIRKGVYGYYLDADDTMDIIASYDAASKTVEFDEADDNSVEGAFSVTWSNNRIKNPDDLYHFGTITFLLYEYDDFDEDEEEYDESDLSGVTVDGDVEECKTGDIVAAGGNFYEITSTAEGRETVKFIGTQTEKVTSVIIPAYLIIDEDEYEVTEIIAGALKENRHLKKVAIGKNVKKIGAKAFFKCSKLKKVIIKTSALTKKSVGRSAFKGISSQARIKVPPKHLKSYQKLLKHKGINGKDQRITK